MQEQAIVLGVGCFWCLDALYVRVKGVTLVESGYAGGDDVNFPNPDYYSVYSKRTGHAEVVRIHFNPEIIQLKTLIFFGQFMTQRLLIAKEQTLAMITAH